MLLARTAGAVHRAGSLVERAEDLARIVHVHGDTHVDLPVGEDVGWRPLLTIAGAEDAFGDRFGVDRSPPGPAAAGGDPTAEQRVVDFLLHDPGNRGSVLGLLAEARDELRAARAVVPGEVWEVANGLWLDLVERRHLLADRQGRADWLRRVVAGCQHLNGVVWTTMRRDEALAFFAVGQYLQRVEVTARVLAVRADSLVPAGGGTGSAAGGGGAGGGDPYDEVRWMSVLRSLAAYQPLRRTMPPWTDHRAALAFVLQDDRFPRSVAACLGEVRSLLKQLPGDQPAAGVCAETALLVADAPVRRLSGPDLRQLAGELELAVTTIRGELARACFPVPVAPGITPGGTATGPDSRAVRAVSIRPSPEPAGPVAGPDGRRYRIVHRTSYQYDAMAAQSFNAAHLRPRDTGSQHCEVHRLDVEPTPSSITEQIDLFGNVVTAFLVAGGFDRLEVTATSEVRVQAPPSPPPGPAWEVARQLLAVDRQRPARDARRLRGPSPLVPLDETLRRYAEASFPEGRPLVSGALDLCSRVHRDFAYDPGFTTVSTPLAQVLDHRRGVCQDFAHVVVGCLRSLGLAARYVSGYIETLPPPGQDRLVGADASHAWASLYVPGWGWFDLDPTNDQAAGPAHITTAWGRDYSDVSPLRGTVEGAGGTRHMEVAVDVVRLDSPVPSG